MQCGTETTGITGAWRARTEKNAMMPTEEKKKKKKKKKTIRVYRQCAGFFPTQLE
jgi:hypothetical protein